MIKEKREEIISNWMARVFNNLHARKSFNKDNIQFENPLLFESIGEFNMIYDYAVSDDESGIVPVAKTLIKFRALNFTNSREVIGYPVELRNSIGDFLLSDIHKNIGILLTINTRIDKLIFAAMDYLLKTREDIYKLKLNELKQGLFANETAGCPSGFWNNEVSAPGI